MASHLFDDGLAPELIDQIMRDTDQWPMGMDEAKRLREELMAERAVVERDGLSSIGGVYFSHRYNYYMG